VMYSVNNEMVSMCIIGSFGVVIRYRAGKVLRSMSGE